MFPTIIFQKGLGSFLAGWVQESLAGRPACSSVPRHCLRVGLVQKSGNVGKCCMCVQLNLCQVRCQPANLNAWWSMSSCSDLLGFGLQGKTGRGHSLRWLWEVLLDRDQWLTLSEEGLVAGSQSDLVLELFGEVPEWSGRSWTSWVQCLNVSALPGNTHMALTQLHTLCFRAFLKALLPSRGKIT